MSTKTKVATEEAPKPIDPTLELRKMLEEMKLDLEASKAAVSESRDLSSKLTERVRQLDETRQSLQAKIAMKDNCLMAIQKFNNDPYMAADMIRRNINKESDLALNEAK